MGYAVRKRFTLKSQTQQNKNFVAFKEDLCYNKGTQRADTIRQA